MKLNNLFMLLFLAISASLFAQPANPENQYKIDGIAAVIGNEIVLESDIERDYFHSKADGMDVTDKCDFLNNTLMEKVLLDRAKQDTLIVVTNDAVTRAVEGQIEDFIRRAGGDEKVLLEYFGMKTMAELKNDLQYVMRDNLYVREKQRMVSGDIDATPQDVYEFFQKFESEMPDIPDEVEMAHIVIYPDIEPENEEKVVKELLKIKKDVEEGASFSTKAILYSKDPGSSDNGGLYQKVKRGKMVPEFDAVVFNLEEGEISEPFKTDFGYHIAMLEKRRGQEVDVRHILITLEPTQSEINAAVNKLDSLRLLINEGKLTFREVAYRYSVDKYTKYNGGTMMNPQTGENRFEKMKLSGNDFTKILELEEGDLSTVFEDTYNNKKVVRLIKLNQVIPAHKINFETDFSRLKNFTKRYKEQEVLTEWVKKQIPDSFIKIGEAYKDCTFPLDWFQEGDDFIPKKE